MAPRIGIAPDIDAAGRASVEPAYAEALLAVGGDPRPLHPGAEDGLFDCSGLLLCGGAFDIPPDWYGQRATARIDAPRLARSQLERELLLRAERAALPVLGICGGAQLMAVLRGGTLIQDIASGHPGALDHERGSEKTRPVHAVALAPASRLARWLGCTSLAVNSSHHQAVAHPGRGVRAVGWAPDGLIEAIEDGEHSFWIGVQWHPERLRDEPSRRLFAALIDAAAARGRPA